MKFLNRMEKRLGFLAVPNLVLTLIVAQLFIYAAILIGRVEFSALLLVPKAVLGGEWWRLVSFLLAPPYLAGTLFQALFLAFFWYIFWMMSQTLEAAWGVFRLNIYLFTSILLAVAGVFMGQLIAPQATLFVVPKFLFYTTFFAYATVNPNMQFLIFFVIPMKVKWLAWIIAGVGFIVFLSMPTMGHRIAFVAPYIGYLLFFKDALRQSMESRQRRSKFQAERRDAMEAPLHTCELCGATDKTHPERDFRYKTVDGETICVCEACRDAQT
jgi:hypothetical protein